MHLPVRRTLALAAAGVAAVAAARPARAQATPPPAPRRQAVAVNLLGIPFGWVTGEYERALGAGATFGVAGSYIQPGDEDDNLTSIDAKLRYYPSERGLRGFSIGLTAGYARIEERATYFSSVGNGTVNATIRTRVTDGPTLGVVADYNWLIGTQRRVLVGLGLGAKRLLIDKQDEGTFEFDLTDIRAYPTMRFVVGLAF